MQSKLDLKTCLEKIRSGFSLDPYNQIVAKGHELRMIDFDDKENHFIVKSDERINQLRTMAKIMCFADVLNKETNWQPEYGEMAYYLDAKLDVVYGNNIHRVNFIPFKNIHDAEHTAEILCADQDFRKAGTFRSGNPFGVKSDD